jgi:(2Fe-2S) ferredoxin
MNKLVKKIDTAKGKWDKLKDNREPIVYIGAASCGRAAGALELKEAAKAFLDDNKKSARVIEVGCIGPCYLEPLVDIKMPGQPRVSYNNVNAKTLQMILKSHFVNGEPHKKLALGHFGTDDLDGIPRFWDCPC